MVHFSTATWYNFGPAITLRSTVMTSNWPLDEWGKLIGDVPTATAILDRILQKAEIIQITGRSYRLKDRAYGKKKEEKVKN